jgi:hypothetical protein
MRLGPTLMALFKLNFFYKGLTFQNAHIPRYWGLGLGDLGDTVHSITRSHTKCLEYQLEHITTKVLLMTIGNLAGKQTVHCLPLTSTAKGKLGLSTLQRAS